MDYNTPKQFGDRLKNLRTKKCMTMDDISIHIGIARSTYAGYETQNRFAPVENLVKIAFVLGTSSDYLLGLTDTEEPKNITRDINEYLTFSNLNWNGLPLSDDDVKTMKDLFNIVMRERMKTTSAHPNNDEHTDNSDKFHQFDKREMDHFEYKSEFASSY